MIAIPNMKKPNTCDDCIVPLSKCDFLQRRADKCPLIEIDKETEHHILNLWEYAKDMGVNMEQARKDLTVADLVTCKECKHFHYDKPYVIQGMPILGHEVCDFWGDGCKTNPNGFCSYGERRAE